MASLDLTTTQPSLSETISPAITTHLPLYLSSEEYPNMYMALIILSICALITSFTAVVVKLILVYIIPISWKFGLILRDVSSVTVALGLLMAEVYVKNGGKAICSTAGFFMLFGVMDLTFNLAFVAFTIIVLQDPFKTSQLSKFRWGLLVSIVVPQKIVFVILALLPVIDIEYFEDNENTYPLICFPIRQEGEKGATFGAILVFIVWIILVIAIIFCIINIVRFQRSPGTRIHASSPSIWQIQKLEQGRAYHKFCLVDLGSAILIISIVTITVYTNDFDHHTPQWVALTTMSIAILIRSFLAVVQLVMWTRLCCNEKTQKKEPYHRLKQLQLIKNEVPGKLRMKANWTLRKGGWKQGLLKVYGPSHIKAWAKEIVVLGLLRKSGSASVLQCLWTSNSNPYYETMTLISGEIVTSDSRYKTTTSNLE